MKKLHILRIAILIALSLLVTEKHAYSFNDHKQLSFSHLTPMDGLSQVLANDIYVDEFGMIWVGTRDGLNCYNGKDIQIFRYEKGNPNSLFSNNIIHITGDGCGHLFITCADGIAGYDMRSGCFSVLYNGIISALHYDGCLYAASGNKLLKLGENNTFNVCLELDESEKITSLYISGKEALIGTEASGLWEVDLADNRKSNIIADYDIFNIYSDSSSSKWISTSGDGLFCIEPDGNIIHYLHSPDDNSSLPSDHVRCCCEDELGAIWVGTFKGLERLDRSTGTFTHFDISDGMTHDSVLCMKKDAQGTIWAGTYFGGVNYINPEYEIYHKYVSALTPENGLSLSVVGRILEDKNGDLWIATEGGGVNYYNRKEGTFRWYLGPEGGKLSADHIKSLYFDDESQVLWIGTHLGGLDRLDVKTGRVDVFRSKADDERSLPSDIIRDILPYGDSLVLATQKGVCTFCKRDGRCRRLFKNSEEGNLIVMVDDIELDSHGRLWVAANKDGIFRYDFPNDDLVHFTTQNSAISNNTINNIYEDHIGRIWLSTDGSGIDVFSQETETFHNYDISKSGYLSEDKQVTLLNMEYVIEEPCKARKYDGEEVWVSEYIADADISIDFDSLIKRNQDVVGWVRVDNTNISYPVLEKYGTTAEYLNKDIDGKPSHPGSICKDSWYYTTHPMHFYTFFGHNIKSPGIMFHEVERFYYDEDFFNAGNRIRYYLPNGGMLVYRVIYAGIENVISKADWENPSLIHTYKHTEPIGDEYLEMNREYRELLRNGAFNMESPGTKIIKVPELQEDTPLIALQTCVTGDNSHRIYVVGIIEGQDIGNAAQ